jgi:hypothetical protein
MDTNDFVGMVMSDASASDMEDAIKQLLYNKSTDIIDDIRPIIAAQLFDPTLETDEE